MQFFSGVLLFSCFALIKSSDVAENNLANIFTKINEANVETDKSDENLTGKYEIHTISHVDKTDVHVFEMKEIDGAVIVTSRHVFNKTDVKFMRFDKKGEIKVTNYEPNLISDEPVINDEIFFHKWTNYNIDKE